MNITFRIYTLKEEWVQIDNDTELRLTRTCWGKEFPTEEEAVCYLQGVKDYRDSSQGMKYSDCKRLAPEMIEIVKIITI